MIEHEKIELFIPDASYGNSAHHLNLSEQEASNRFKEDLRSALEEFEKTSSEIKLTRMNATIRFWDKLRSFPTSWATPEAAIFSRRKASIKTVCLPRFNPLKAPCRIAVMCGGLLPFHF